MDAFWMIAGYALWGALHSLLAREAVQARLRPLFGRAYRLAYNLFAAVTFLPLLWLRTALPDEVLYRLPAPWDVAARLLQALAAGLLLAGVLQTDALAFAGWRQLWQGVTDEYGPLTVRGLYAWVRHPLYSAGLLFLWADPLITRNGLLFNLLTTLYIVIGMQFEERKLLRVYGADYARYRERVPALLPRLPRR